MKKKDDGQKVLIPVEATSAAATARTHCNPVPWRASVIILNAPYSTIHVYYHFKCDPYRLIELMSNGIDKALGNELSSIIYKTMNLFYKLCESNITSNPTIPKEMLERMKSKSVADIYYYIMPQ
jgi:hypothetical protein